VRIPVSATRLVNLVLLSASLTLAFLMSVSLRNLSVSAAHDPHHGDLNLISKTCADLLQLAFSNPSFEVSVTLAFPLQAFTSFTTLCKFVVVEKMDYDVVFGEYENNCLNNKCTTPCIINHHKCNIFEIEHSEKGSSL